MTLPNRLFINAYSGDLDPGSALHVNAKRWVGKKIEQSQGTLRPQALPDLSEWRSERVGWGLVLPDNPSLSPEKKATADDAPEPIRRLVESRENAVILRYSSALPKTKLRRYDKNGNCYDPDLIASADGVGKGCIPKYLLIYASPSVIPWEFQYIAGATRYVGRLDIDGDELENYIRALLDDWNDTPVCVEKAVVWAVDHGEGDITHLMRRVVAYKLNKALAGDEDIDTVFLDGKTMTVTNKDLITTLEGNKPGLIVTSSHGMTGPLDDVKKMRSQLGLPIDSNHAVLDIKKLLNNWQPSGAIWYAHACCAAGGDASTEYEGLVAEDSYADSVLKGITKTGAMVSPLPQALLGAEQPLRAFVGHVEPTFDWTLRDRDTGQVRTNALVKAFYDRLFQPMPIGRALEKCHRQGPQLDSVHKRIIKKYGQGTDDLEEALTCRLIAQDLESLVILGDPTVALPVLY